MRKKPFPKKGLKGWPEEGMGDLYTRSQCENAIEEAYRH